MESATETALNETTTSLSNMSLETPSLQSTNDTDTDVDIAASLLHPLNQLRHHIAALNHATRLTHNYIQDLSTRPFPPFAHLPTLRSRAEATLSDLNFAATCLTTLASHATALLRDPSPTNVEAARQALREPVPAPPSPLRLACSTSRTFDALPSGLALEATLSRALHCLPAGAVVPFSVEYEHEHEREQDDGPPAQQHQGGGYGVPMRPVGWKRRHDERLRRAGGTHEGAELVALLRREEEFGLCVGEEWVDQRLLQLQIERPRGWSDRHDAVLEWFCCRHPPEYEEEEKAAAWLWRAAAYVSNNCGFMPLSTFYVRQRVEELGL